LSCTSFSVTNSFFFIYKL